MPQVAIPFDSVEEVNRLLLECAYQGRFPLESYTLIRVGTQEPYRWFSKEPYRCETFTEIFTPPLDAICA